MICFWCHTETDSLTDDHIIPYSLGGTTDYTVKACVNCQNRLSKAEHEVARKSMLAIHALTAPMAPRHPERPTSGHLKPEYFMVKHPEGGYGETLFSAGERASLLPYFEIKVVPGEALEGRVRGTTEGARRLLDIFRRGLKNTPRPDRFLFEIKVSCELDRAISDDKSFWPRIVLLPGDRLLLRGRNPDEIKRFMHVFMQLATSDYAVPEAWSSTGGEIKGGTPHLLALKFDPQAVRRVAAKVAFGLFATVANGSLDSDRDVYLRHYILGQLDSTDEPVFEAPNPVTTTTSNNPHYIVLSPAHDPQSAVVSLYGFVFRIELGPQGKLSKPVVMICQIDASGIRPASPDEIREIIDSISGIAFTQPWRRPPEVTDGSAPRTGLAAEDAAIKADPG
jgi:hypothetical protein